MKSRYLLAGLASEALIGFAMPAVSADSPQDFVTKAANGGMFEVESSKLAVEEGGKDVQGFAQKMITDHGPANAKLQEIAKEQKLSIPAELDAKHKADLDALKGPSETFDASYVKMQRDAHSDAVALFESYAKEGDNAALKTFAQETVPTLKMHKEAVDKLATDSGSQSSNDGATTGESAAAPVPGANSFTQDQAQDRIQGAGYSAVSELVKDDEGIWRGKATKDGKEVPIALDYQGNVVSETQ